MSRVSRLALVLPLALSVGAPSAVAAQTITLATPVTWDFNGVTYRSDRWCLGTLIDCQLFMNTTFMPWWGNSGAAAAGRNLPYGGTDSGTPLAGWPDYNTVFPNDRGVYFLYAADFDAITGSGWTSVNSSKDPNFVDAPLTNAQGIRAFAMVPEINGSGFAYIAFILGALGLWLHSGAGRGRAEGQVAAT